MVIKNSISKETSLLIAVLFDNSTISNNDFADIDYEKLTYILSQHLVLPAFYANLRDKNYLDLVPYDFGKYIKKIYEINKERNKTLINEMKEIISKNNTKIVDLCDHCFEIEIQKYDRTLHICNICGYTY